MDGWMDVDLCTFTATTNTECPDGVCVCAHLSKRMPVNHDQTVSKGKQVA